MTPPISTADGLLFTDAPGLVVHLEMPAVDEPAPDCWGCSFSRSRHVALMGPSRVPALERRRIELGVDAADFRTFGTGDELVVRFVGRVSWSIVVAGVEVAAGEWAGPADINVDGFVDGVDYDAFVAAWLDGDADFNHDGFTDGLDYDAFIAAWRAGQ